MSLRSVDGLLAEIYAHPTDDGPRLVLADLLQEAGDPRGELIALQCRGGDPAREKALLVVHARAWMGEIGVAVAKGSGRDRPVFRRGFLASAYLTFKNPQEAVRIGGDPAWATLDRLVFGKDGRMTEAMRHARVVRIACDTLDYEQGASLFGDGPPWAIEELAIDHGAAGLATTTRLPRLRILRTSNRVELFDAPIAAQLEELECTDLSTKLVVEAGKRFHKLRELRFTARRAAWRLVFTRDPDGAFTIATLVGGVPEVTVLDEALAALRPRTLRVDGACDRAAILATATARGIGEVVLAGERHAIGGWRAPVTPPPKPVIEPDLLDHPDAVCFAPSGCSVWVAVQQGTRRFTIPELEPGALVGSSRMYRSPLIRGGDRIASVAFCRVSVRDGETGTEDFDAPTRTEVDDAAFSPDGKLMATGLRNGGVLVWNLAQRVAASPWKIVPRCADHVAFSPDGTLLAVGSRYNTLAVAHVARHRTIWRLQPNPSAIAFASNDRLLAVITDPRMALVALATADGTELACHPYPSWAAGIRVVGDRAFIGWGDDTVSAHDLATLAEVWRVTIGAGNRACELDVSSDGTRVAVVRYTEQRLVLLDAATGAVVNQR